METSDLHLATDNHEVGATGKSIFDSVSDVITKGVPLTGLSVYNSFVNTGVDISNFFGAKAERNDPYRQLQGRDDNLLSYYTEHADAIEGAGLIAGSFIPGTVAVKALRLAQVGKFGENIARATGLMSGKKQVIIDDAIEQINAGKSGLFGTIQQDKWKAIAYGFGDQALQAAAWETATIATMKANPLLDKDTMSDVISHVFWGTAVGGGVGGVLEGFGIRGIINRALLDHDTKEKAYEIAMHLGKGNFNAGDRVVALIDSIDKMPAATTASSSTKALRTRAQSELDSWKILKEISPEADENLGKTLLDTLYKMRYEQQIGKEEMYDYLARLSRIGRVNQFSEIPAEKVFYINYFKGEDALKNLERLQTSVPEADAEMSLAYRVKDPNAQLRVARFTDSISNEAGTIKKYSTKAEAFKAGEDIFIDAKEVHINPESEAIQRVPRPGETRVLTEDEERAFRKTGKLPEGADKLGGAPLYFNVLTGAIR